MQASSLTKEETCDREGRQLVHGGETTQAHWLAPMTPIVYDHHHEHHHDHDHHHKKSVIAKVKEKAKKWRHAILKKKHGHDDEENTTPTSRASSTPRTPTTPSGFSLDKEDESTEEDPEYHGAPMYESEMASKMYIERASKHQEAVPSPKTPKSVLNQPLSSPNSTIHHSLATILEAPQAHGTEKAPKLHHLNSFKETSIQHNLIAPETSQCSQTLVTETKPLHEAQDSCNHNNNNNKTLTETVTEMLAPAYNIVSDATHKIAAKIKDETVTDMLAPAYNIVSDATHKIAAKIQSPTARDESGSKMVWDKGVSVKEYLLQKLEPGEEEKALSEVITEAMSPRKVGAPQGEEMSVVEKVKGAVSSLLGKEEQISSNSHPNLLSSSSASENVHTASDSVSKVIHGTSRPLFKNAQGDLGSSILASKDTHGYAHGYLIAKSKRTHTNTSQIYENSHEALITTSKASKDTHGILDFKHTRQDSSPLPISTNPVLVQASTKSPTTSATTNPLLINESTNSLMLQSSTQPYAEVEETGGRRLQAYAN